MGITSTISAVACFGAIHIDLIAHADRPIRRETSTPGRVAWRPGGVAANVARGAVRLGVSCTLTGAIGRDRDGERLAGRLSAEGINLQLDRRDAATGRYIALHDPDGTLAAALVDAEITDTLPADALLPVAPAAIAAPLWFVEANLPAPVLAALAEAASGRRLAADAVSCAKAGRLSEILPHLDMLFLNRAEAAVLAGMEPDAAPERLAEALLRRGAAALALTDGAAPTVLADGTGLYRIEPLPARPVDVTGAGDALVAGWLAATARGADRPAALQAGLAAAAITLETTGAVADNLDWVGLTRRLAAAKRDAGSATIKPRT